MSQILQVKFVDSIAEIGQSQWNALTGIENPFTRYEFLWALEHTGCTSKRSGWQPHHAMVVKQDQPDDNTVAVIPLYLKTNSYGEYVFDWSWANAYQSYGMDYYPKFVTSAPFTPSYGKRLFIKQGEDQDAIVRLLKTAIEDKARFINASSWHVLFPTETEHQQLSGTGMLARNASQFHWFNRDYQNFEQFLEALNSRKRKNIRKERSKVAADGFSFRRIEGAAIDTTLWQDFYVFYQSTYMMRGMQGYLSQNFFIEISKAMPEQLFMVCAEQDGRVVAAALFFKNSETLFGRYWGSARDYQFLHFETCFYQGQDYAIEHRLKRFDSGAQGEHKIQRGFEPILTYSNHWIANQGFADAIENFLAEEKPQIKRYMEQARQLLPYKQERS